MVETAPLRGAATVAAVDQGKVCHHVNDMPASIKNVTRGGGGGGGGGGYSSVCQ